MSVTKIEGFNSKENRLYNVLKDGKPHNIRELKKLFWAEAKEHCAKVYEKGWGESEINSQAQSYVRNSVRRLIRDGWVDGPHMRDTLNRGTYKMNKRGLERVRNGVAVTSSAKSKKETKPKGKKTAKAKPKVKVAAKKNGNPKQKAKEAAARAAKGVVKQKAAAASERAAKNLTLEDFMVGA